MQTNSCNHSVLNPPDKIQTVSDLIVRFLKVLDIHHIFGIPGAHILPVYDSLFNSTIIPVLAKHEQGAAFMAGGYAKASGRIGACITTAGPGATNLATGLANAYADKTPVLAITGETPTYSFGKGALQESSGQGGSIDQHGFFQSITNYHRIVERTDYLDQVFRKAYSILTSPNPGPVLLSFPYNILKEEVALAGDFLLNIKQNSSGVKRQTDVVSADIIPEFVLKSKRPVIIAGYGALVSGANEELFKFSKSLGIPVATSLKGRGLLPESSELSLGVLGVTSRELALRYIEDEADLLILAGISFGERTSYNWKPSIFEGKTVIRLDNNPDQLQSVITATLSVCGDVRTVFERLNLCLDKLPQQKKDTSVVAEYKQRYPDPNIREDDFVLVKEFLARLDSKLGNDSLIFDDNIIYMQNFVTISKPGRYFPNSGISSLGQSIPAAIGAQLASPSRPVVALLGDGGFQMCCMEIMTAVNHSVPLTVVLLNNSSLGLVRKNQHYNYHDRFISCDFVNPDYELLARSFGINHWRVTSQKDIDHVLDEAKFDSGINLIEVIMYKNNFPNYSSGR